MTNDPDRTRPRATVSVACAVDDRFVPDSAGADGVIRVDPGPFDGQVVSAVDEDEDPGGKTRTTDLRTSDPPRRHNLG